MYKISVIVPIFNVGNLLEECLDSLVYQSIGIENLQIICVNDASPLWEKEKEIQKFWYEKYPKNFVILNNDQNLGLGMSRNKGLKFAKGEYVHFVDADDRVKLHLYLEAYQYLKKTHSQLFRLNYYRETRGQKKHYQGNSSQEGLMSDADKTRALFYSYAWLNITDIRLVRRMKRFPEGIYEDMEATPTLFQASYGRFYQSSKPGYYYRINPSSITAISKKNLEERDTLKLRYLYETLLDFVNKEYFPIDYGILIAQFFLIYMTSCSRESLESFKSTMNTLKTWKNNATVKTRVRLHPDTVKDYGWKVAVANQFLLLLWRWNSTYLLYVIRKILITWKKRFQTR